MKRQPAAGPLHGKTALPLSKKRRRFSMGSLRIEAWLRAARATGWGIRFDGRLIPKSDSNACDIRLTRMKRGAILFSESSFVSAFGVDC